MSSEPDSNLATEERLNEAIAAYIRAIEAGETPNRREILDHAPELAAELETFFAGRDQVDRLVAPLRSAVEAAFVTPVPDETPREHVARNGHAFEAPGRSFGDYELLEEIGRGGMGVVYRARQRSLNRLVALKMVRIQDLASPVEAQRFRNEAETVGALDHPHIVPIYEVGERDGYLYYTMRLVEGGSLDKRLAEYIAKPRAAAQLVATVAKAVHHAHQRGVLHRDLKPGNILLGSDVVRPQVLNSNVGFVSDFAFRISDLTPYVSDFGLAKRVESDSALTLSGALVGTPSYMAPEQTTGKKGAVTTATDVYGLGALLYALLTGRPPFRGDSVLDTLTMVREGEPEAPGKLNPKIDRDLETICLECLQKEPERRYGSTMALAEDLERWLAGEPILARPISRAAQGWRWCLRNPVVAALTASAGLLLVLLIGGLSLGLVLVSAKETDAQNNRREAELQKAKAQDQAAALRRRVYVADMTAAHEAWQVGDVDTTLAILRGQIPNEGQEDLRGFDWHYLNRMASQRPREVGILDGHEGDVYSGCYGENGKSFVTAGKDRAVRLWATDSRPFRQVAKFPHADEVNCVAYAPDAKSLASCTDDGLIHLWDIDSVKEKRTFAGHQGEVAFVEFSPDGKTLASCGRDGTVRLWDVAAGTGTILGKDEHPYEALAISPNGKWVAAVGGGDNNQGVVRIWDLATRRTHTGLSPEDRCIYAIAFSPDSKRLATGGGLGSLKTWNPENLEIARDMHCRNYAAVDSLLYTHNGEWIITGRSDGTCEVWDARFGSQIACFQTNCGRLWRISAPPTPCGPILATAGSTGPVRIWDLGGLDENTVLKQPEPRVCSLAFTPNSKRLAVGYEAGNIHLWEISSGRFIRSLGPLPVLGSSPNLAVSPDGQILAAGYSSAIIALWDLSTGLKPTLIPFAEGHPKSAYFPDGKNLAVTNGKAFVLWDVKDGQCLISEKLSWDFDYLATARSGGLLAIDLGGIHSWDRHQKKWSTKAIEDPVRISCVATSADGGIMARGHQTGTIELRQVSTGDLLATLAAHRNVVRSVAFSPDGKTLASAGDDGALQLWNVPTAQKLFTLARMEGIGQLAFSPDGRLLAAAVSVGKQPAEVLLWHTSAESVTAPSGP